MAIAQRTQLCRSADGLHLIPHRIIKGPFDCEVEGHKFQLVVVKCKDDGGHVRSLVDVRSGMRVGRISAVRFKNEVLSAIGVMLAAYAKQFPDGEVRRRIESQADLP